MAFRFGRMKFHGKKASGCSSVSWAAGSSFLLLFLVVLQSGCASIPPSALANLERIYGEQLEENIYLRDVPMTGSQKGIRTAARVLTPIELPGLIVMETLFFLPFQLLDFEWPDYPLSTWWTRLVLEENGDKATRGAIECPMGLSGIAPRKCMEYAYQGEREESLKRADALLERGRLGRAFTFTIPIRAYLLFGEDEKATEAIHCFAAKSSRWPIYSPTDLMSCVPFYGMLPALASYDGWVGNQDAIGLGLVVRYICDRGYSRILDPDIMQSLDKINGGLQWQTGLNLLPLHMMALNNDGRHQDTLALAASGLVKEEAEFEKHDRKDAYDRNHANFLLPLALVFFPPPAQVWITSEYGSEFPPRDAVYPGRYRLALAYLEHIRALQELGKPAEAHKVLTKLEAVTEGRDWCRWISLEGRFLAKISAEEFEAAAAADRELIQDALSNAQFTRLLSHGKQRGEILEKAGKAELALQSYRGVIDALDSLYRQAGKDTALSEGFNREHLPFYHRVIELSVALKKPPADILLLAERTKSRILSQSLLAKATEASHIVPELREEYRMLSAKYKAQRIQAAAFAKPGRREKAHKSAEYIRQRMSLVEARSGETGGARTGFLATIDDEEALTVLRSADTSLVYWLGETFSLCFQCNASGAVTMRKLPPRSQIRERVASYRMLLKDPTTNPLNSAVGKELARDLIPDKNLSGQVLIVPDKELYLLPFGALPMENDYFIAHSQPVYAPSLSVALALQKRQRPTTQRDLLALADPLFNSSGKRSAVRGHAGHFERSGVGLTPLPGTRREIETISGIFSDPETLSGQDATEAALRTVDPSQFRYLHFATHGLLGDDPVGPGEPALALASPTKKNRKQEDGFLTSSEVVQMELNAELVTLSACNTAAGKLSTGDGVASLASAFLSAGAGGVVVTTWPVADEATAELMEAFYRNLVNGKPTPVALHEAKMALMTMGLRKGKKSSERGARIVVDEKEGSELSHPYYWAPFIYMGKP